MKILFCTIALLFALPVLASELTLWPVGDFGGHRVWTTCSFPGGAPSENCMFDTGSDSSITVERPTLPIYPIVGHADGVDCPVVRIDSFKFGELVTPPIKFIRCPRFNGIDSAVALIGRDVLGKSAFSLSFSSKKLDWNPQAPAKLDALERLDGWLVFGGAIDRFKVRIGFDTGTPITLISSSWVAKHPKYFEPSKIAVGPSLAALGIKAYELKSAIEVGGVSLQPSTVHAMELDVLPIPATVDVVLGTNHMIQADWYFDLSSNRWSVTK